jgi:hypothetical protein
MAKTHHHTQYIIDLGCLILPASKSNFNEQIIFFCLEACVNWQPISTISSKQASVKYCGFFQ